MNSSSPLYIDFTKFAFHEGTGPSLNSQVSTFLNLHFDVKNFVAGNVKNCFPAWRELTSDSSILNIIQYG